MPTYEEFKKKLIDVFPREDDYLEAYEEFKRNWESFQNIRNLKRKKYGSHHRNKKSGKPNKSQLIPSSLFHINPPPDNELVKLVGLVELVDP